MQINDPPGGNISEILDNVAPIKEIKIKNNTHEWFDNEIAETINQREIFQKV